MRDCPTVQTVSYASPEYTAVWHLRDAVLRQPIGLSLRDEDLRGEADELILALFEGDEAVGCVLMQPLGDAAGKLRQMAVAPHRQRQGLGQQLIRAAEDAARTEGRTKLVLHARETAVPFYESLGYTVTGTRFSEVGIPHWAMEKQLEA